MMWEYRHDWGITGGWGGGAFNMIIWPLAIVALVVGVIWFIRSPSYSGAGRLQLPRRSSGVDIRRRALCARSESDFGGSSNSIDWLAFLRIQQVPFISTLNRVLCR